MCHACVMVQVYPIMPPKSGKKSTLVMPAKLNTDVTAMDTTQARVALHDAGGIKSSHFRIWFHY